MRLASWHCFALSDSLKSNSSPFETCRLNCVILSGLKELEEIVLDAPAGFINFVMLSRMY